MTHAPDKGSTLIELLISLTILGLILVIILGAFRIGIRAWETGEKGIDDDQRQEMAFSVLKRQLSSACDQTVTPEEGNAFVFKGDAQSVAFVSGISAVPGDEAGHVQVGYRVEKNEAGDGDYLEITEQPWLPGSGGETRAAPADAPLAHRLLSGIRGATFEYLKIMPDDAQWQPEWNPEKDAGLPAAVRFTVQMADGKAPVIMIARLLPGMDSGQQGQGAGL